MTGDLFINGKDALETWGARMGDSFLDAIDGFNEMKDYIENESRLEHGKRVITDNAKVDSREITLQFTIEGSSESDYRIKKKAFQKELEKGAVNIKVPVLGNEVYKLIYLGKSVSYGLSLDRCFGKISSKFEEPNPMDRSE
ncbi:MAG TPA: hypothetical protein OIM59_09095 [Bacteroides mediterraneensis]|uniref:hypothetical protein n=1 Tax=Bacteroides mediterraneensis TaxID=1841856 RepID=UPI0026EE853F|nr:hypothetical protein [Bacteroides mediterraneensis]HJH64767.1 hypothetical protein [Bacteroides mediterraneensis]